MVRDSIFWLEKLLVVYDFFALVAFEQIVRLVKSKRYQQYYGTDPFNPKHKGFTNTEQQNPEHPFYIMPEVSAKWWQVKNFEQNTIGETCHVDEMHKYFQYQELLPDVVLNNGMNTDETQPNGLMRQHGNYWVWHDYIRRSEDLKGKESITLTSHATYMDLGLLPTLLERWQAPISLAIYACGSDFDKTVQSLAYLNYCLKQGDLMRRFLSIHLVMDGQHVPENLDRFGTALLRVPSDKCEKPAPFERMRQDQTFWNKLKLSYPVNLLRNVARFNAQTYYIMALDLQLVPPPNFVRKFLKFAWRNYLQSSDTCTFQKSIYCLPTFAHKPHAPLAQSKSQLITDPEGV
ncbi:hypothetical protein ACLKA6_000071 [Drosophila palustris]